MTRFWRNGSARERVMGGSCVTSVSTGRGPGVIEHLAQGQISIGEYDDWVRPRTHDIATEFKRMWGDV